MERNHHRTRKFKLQGLPEFGTIKYESEKSGKFFPFKTLNNFTPLHLESNDWLYRRNKFNIALVKNNGLDGCEEYKIEVDLNEALIYRCNDDYFQETLFFHFRYPPNVYKKANKDNYVIHDGSYHSIYAKELKLKQFKKIKDDSVVKFNYKITGPDSANYVRVDSFFNTESELKNFYMHNFVMALKVRRDYIWQTFDQYYGISYNIDTSFKLELFENEVLQQESIFLQIKKDYFNKHFFKLIFNLQFAVLSLITSNALDIFTINIRFIEYLSKLDNVKQEKAAEILEKLIEDNYFNEEDDYFSMFINDFEKLTDFSLNKLEDDEMKIRTIEVTPSIIYYKIPEVGQSNGFMRKFKNIAQNFIKVNFYDDNYENLYYGNTKMWVIVNFIQRILLSGIIVGSRYFNFIAASSSQMKSSSFWFICLEGTEYDNVESIIDQVGDFSEENNFHKNAARRGQLLSTTRHICTLDEKKFKDIPDIKRQCTITDGIGTISRSLALKCAKKFGVSYCSAFQIRIAVIKGVVAVDPRIPEEEGDVICYRPSMRKFESEERDLGVIRCSSFSQGYLNRQIIILLVSLGVPEEIFIEMNNNEIKRHKTYMEDPLNYFIKEEEDGYYNKQMSYFKTAIKSFIGYNFDIFRDAFLGRYIQAYSISRLKELKNQGRIIDPNSAVLIGVIDEFNVLERDEVYIQIKKYDEAYLNPICIKGKVFVTKNPCLHPGDIKVLNAVSHEDDNKFKVLSHNINVIVFSSKGERPIFNEISGGDLDGDLYYVSWNKDIVNKIDPEQAYIDQQIENNNQERDITMEDIILSIMDYMKYNLIGIISNSHTRIADSDPTQYANNLDCIKLNQLFQRSVNSSKSGNFVRNEEVLQFSSKDKVDFLEEGKSGRKYNNIIPSPGILGRLFRAVDFTQAKQQFVDSEYNIRKNSDYTIAPHFLTQSCSKYLNHAFEVYTRYHKGLTALMKSYKFRYGAEVFIGQRIYTMEKITDHDKYTHHLNKLRKDTENNIKNIMGEMNCEKAVALYIVTYINNKSLDKYSYEYLKDHIEFNKALKEIYIRKEEFIEDRFSSMRNRHAKKENEKEDYRTYQRIILSLPWFIEDISTHLLEYIKQKFLLDSYCGKC